MRGSIAICEVSSDFFLQYLDIIIICYFFQDGRHFFLEIKIGPTVHIYLVEFSDLNAIIE